MIVLAFVATAILIPMLVTELTAWLPWFASRMISAAARLMPPAYRARYVEEWQAELDALPGGDLAKLVFAVRIWVGVPGTRCALGGTHRARSALLSSAFDKLVALAALVLAAPLLALIALIIRLDGGGPALFKQTRVGRDGRIFSVYKFRSTVTASGSRKAGGPLIRQDPRVTKEGGWLRRWSLDELPQLLNVLAGDMSLVGPRPALPEEAAMYGPYVRRKLAVKPGMTGLWQVNGRSDLSWDESVRLDLRYVENWSFMLDLEILWMTCAAVLRGAGAY
jgi:lipopolysaccharide/colanic/teichoic acid biosynthesis glycosyltransferase